MGPYQTTLEAHYYISSKRRGEDAVRLTEFQARKIQFSLQRNWSHQPPGTTGNKVKLLVVVYSPPGAKGHLSDAIPKTGRTKGSETVISPI